MNKENSINTERSLMKRKINRVILYLILCLVSLTTLFPLIWMLYTSFKTNQEISLDKFSLPTTFHFENYVTAWKQAHIGIYFLNSIFVSVASVLLTMFIGAIAAFVLSKFRFKLQSFVYNIFIIGMLIPLQSVLVPLFIQMRKFHLLDSPWSLILSYTAFGLPITIFILESFMRAFSDEIIEAAIIDGSTIKRVFLTIVLPMSKPALASVVILNFLNNWKEFSFALVFISLETRKTLTLGLYNFLGAETSNYSGLMAALVISSIPIIALFIAMQKSVINGMTAGAVKG